MNRLYLFPVELILWNSILYYLIGTTDHVQFFTGLFFLLLGIFVSLMLHANTRDVNSTSSTMRFSYRFLIKDNIGRLLFSVLLSMILYRFAGNLFTMEDNMYFAFIIGFSFDKIIQIFKDKFKTLK